MTAPSQYHCEVQCCQSVVKEKY